MKLFEIAEKLPSVKTYSSKELAKKHGVSLKKIEAQVTKGIEHELEHTKDRAKAKEIALDHIKELPDYYDRLDKIEEATYAGQQDLYVITVLDPDDSSIDFVAGPFTQESANRFVNETQNRYKNQTVASGRHGMDETEYTFDTHQVVSGDSVIKNLDEWYS